MRAFIVIALVLVAYFVEREMHIEAGHQPQIVIRQVEEE